MLYDGQLMIIEKGRVALNVSKEEDGGTKMVA